MELPKGYSFVAAATLFRNYGGLVMYIRYRKSNKDIYIKDSGKNHIWYVCPDREIVMVRDAFNNEAFRPNESFDECVDLNTFRDELGDHMGMKYWMTNFTHDGICDTNRDAVPEEDKRVQILSDSGGLQLARGVSGMIHPKDLVSFYNKNCDAGMVLDLPLWVKDEKLLKRAAKLQRANNNVMLNNSRPGLELINIFHGNSVEERKMYRNIVEDERIPRVAIGGLLMQKPLTAINSVYEIVYGGSFRYRQHHALGVFNMAYLALLIKMANSGDNPPHITSDSTSHVQSSLSTCYYLQPPDEQHIMMRRPIGTNAEAISNPHMRLTCCCPVCSRIKYRDVFAFGHNRFNGFLALHNAFEMTRYTQSLQHACQTLSPSKFNKYVLTQMKNANDKDDLRMGLEFVDYATQHGLKKAQARYASHLHNWKRAEHAGASLFSEMESEEKKGTQEELYKRTMATLITMENQIKEKK